MENKCRFDKAWVGKCNEPADESGYCETHKGIKCVSCGAQATHECPETGTLVCGAPLCDDCEHTNYTNGTNGGIGFFKVSERPEGMGEHCKKSEQKCFPWYVTSLAEDHPQMLHIIDRFEKGELTYLEADAKLLEFVKKLNEEEKES